MTTPPTIRILNLLRIARRAQQNGQQLDPGHVIAIITGHAKA